MLLQLAALHNLITIQNGQVVSNSNNYFKYPKVVGVMIIVHIFLERRRVF